MRNPNVVADERYVIGGPGPFMIPAENYESFAEEELILEIAAGLWACRASRQSLKV